MALTPEEAAKLAAKITEIERLSRLLGANINTINLQPLEENAGNIEAIFERLNNQAAGLGEETDYLVSNFQKLVGEIKNSGTGINNATKGLRNLSSITEQISNYQKGYNDLSSKDIAKLRDKARIETDRLGKARQIIEDETYELTLQRNSVEFASMSVKQQQAILDKLAKNQIARENINNLLENEDITLGELNNKLREAEINAKHMEKTLGLTGASLKGISKIPLLGDIIDTNSALEAAKNNIKEGGDRTSAMKAAFSNMGKQIKTNLTDPLVIVGFLVTQFIDALTKADTATGDLAKDFNLTYNAAANVRNELIEIGNLSGNIALNARALQESMVAVGQSLGSNAMLNQADLETFTELREMAGYTNEELIGIQKLTLATGGNLKDNTKQFLGTVAALNAQNKLTVNEKQLLKEVSNTSAAIKLSIGGTTKELAASAFQAKQFGINLEQADKIAESLLNFESSITAELEAELITGKDLNLERARLLALNGDIAGASAEILKQVKGSAEFTKMNRIQQESLAKAVGMSREELAASLIEREALQKIGVKDAAAAKAKFDLLVKEKGYAAAVAELGDKEYATQLKQQSIQERFNKSVEKLKEIFISIAEPVLRIISPFMDLITFILPGLNIALFPIINGIRVVGDGINYVINSVKALTSFLTGSNEELTTMQAIIGGVATVFTTLLGLIALYNIALGISAAFSERKALAENASFISIGAQKVAESAGMGIKAASAVLSGTKAIAEVTAAEAISFGLVTFAIIGGLAAVVSAMSDAKPAGDMYSPANGKTQVSTKEGGLFELSKNDSLFAFPESKIKTNPGGSTSTTTNNITQQSIDYDKLASAIGKEVNNKPVIVENSMNGTRFGTAVAMNTYKTQ
jgi:hypothetical protein